MTSVGRSSSKHSSSISEVRVDVEKLVESIRKEIEELDVLSDECCIYRVPQRFKDLNSKLFEPKVVSIGPYHHGNIKLKEMEDHKRRYLADFLHRGGLRLEEFMAGIVDIEIRLRNSYAETFEYSSEVFVKMMAIDGAFVIKYFLKRSYDRDWSENDRILSKQQLTIDVRYDLLLLENQLPWFFLDHLLNLLKPATDISMTKLVNHLLDKAVDYDFLRVDDWVGQKGFQVQHFVDLLRIYMLPEQPHTWKKCEKLDLPTFSELSLAGVKYKLSSSKCLFDMNFNCDKGILEIPELKIDDNTEVLFRNIQVFEQCHACKHSYVDDYICIMDMLINTAEDVALLVKKGIIKNWVEDNNAAAQVINNLSKECLVSSNFYFTDLIEGLNAYSNSRLNKWKAGFKEKYLSNPWTIASVIAAVVLLILTVIQTVCSIVQVI